MHLAIRQAPKPAVIFTLIPILAIGVFSINSASALVGAPHAARLGANKFDLALQYLGRAPAGVNAEAYAEVAMALARKSLDDARAAGVAFFRIAISGFRPVSASDAENDLALWTTQPDLYWRRLDVMFDDLDRYGVQLVPTFLWNYTQFSSLARESVRAIALDADSRSRKLLYSYIDQFVSRYSSRKTILFYEFSNELNLVADMDMQQSCAADLERMRVHACDGVDNFKTDEMIAFSRDVAQKIRAVDATRPISSGYSLPRRAAFHLAQRPAFEQGADWRIDSDAEDEDYIARIHEPFDIVSIHVYPHDANSWGVGDDNYADAIRRFNDLAKKSSKRLFIGEYGDRTARPFLEKLINEILRDSVAYSALWVWEFYQTSTHETYNTEPTRFNVEPGYSDEILALMKTATGASEGPKAPNVVLTWPLPCAAVLQPTELFAVASAGVKGVETVEFRVAGKLIGLTNSPPYRVNFDPAPFGPGKALIEARARDASGRISASSSLVALNGSKAQCAGDDMALQQQAPQQ
jgi:hypothetical protein